MMIAGLPGDPIRIITILASLVALFISIWRIWHGDGFMPRQVFFASWCFHVVVFYGIYFFSRWAPPFDVLRPWWPPVLVTHAALTILALEIWGLIEDECDE